MIRKFFYATTIIPPILFLCWLIIAAYSYPFSLYAANANYDYLPAITLKIFFKVYPYLILASLGVFILKRSIGIIVLIILSLVFFLYYLLPFSGDQCVQCLCAGLIPYLSIKVQFVLSSMTLILISLSFILQRDHYSRKFTS